jgi:hypothetical protein
MIPVNAVTAPRATASQWTDVARRESSASCQSEGCGSSSASSGVPRLVVAFAIVSISLAGVYGLHVSPQRTIPWAPALLAIIAIRMTEVLTLF